jgi:hypothetical protein
VSRNRTWDTGCPGIEPGIQGVQHKSLEYRVSAQESGVHGVDHKKPGTHRVSLTEAFKGKNPRNKALYRTDE